MRKRLGVTMRVVQAPDSGEARDALAQDWYAFLTEALEVVPVPIPNLGAAAVAYVQELGVEALLLTGGEDVGASPSRDGTERALLGHALASGLPVIGVCRGLQMIQDHFGGRLARCGETHVNRPHPIELVHERFGLPGSRRDVNSFHHWGVRREALASPLAAFAVSPDGFVEGCFHPEAPLVAVQWHPERAGSDRQADAKILRSVLQTAGVS